jgi:hypothetical protein
MLREAQACDLWTVGDGKLLLNTTVLIQDSYQAIGATLCEVEPCYIQIAICWMDG